MQEQYKHLTKRHQILKLFHPEIEDENPDGEWHSADRILPNNSKNDSYMLLAKFDDGDTEKVYFCDNPPHWWYVRPKFRDPVITKEIMSWRYLKKT